MNVIAVLLMVGLVVGLFNLALANGFFAAGVALGLTYVLARHHSDRRG